MKKASDVVTVVIPDFPHTTSARCKGVKLNYKELCERLEDNFRIAQQDIQRLRQENGDLHAEVEAKTEIVTRLMLTLSAALCFIDESGKMAVIRRLLGSVHVA